MKVGMCVCVFAFENLIFNLTQQYRKSDWASDLVVVDAWCMDGLDGRFSFKGSVLVV